MHLKQQQIIELVSKQPYEFLLTYIFIPSEHMALVFTLSLKTDTNKHLSVENLQN